MRKYNLLDSLASLECLELKLSPSSLAGGVVAAQESSSMNQPVSADDDDDDDGDGNGDGDNDDDPLPNPEPAPGPDPGDTPPSFTRSSRPRDQVGPGLESSRAGLALFRGRARPACRTMTRRVAMSQCFPSRLEPHEQVEASFSLGGQSGDRGISRTTLQFGPGARTEDSRQRARPLRESRGS